ncbi:MAG: NUDIX domain-containing protein [Bacilli bacterium]|nr:NUDIX domain-containing protein [Bacilli bacterium]
MELLDLYDKNKRLTGKVIKREKGMIIEEGLYINVVLIFIQNSSGKFLLQLTSKEKGSVIATTGGHVKHGQTSYEAIIAEVKEEIGIDIQKEEVKHIKSEIFNKVIFDIYYLEKNIDINKLILQAEEVESVMWLSAEEIEKLINEDKVRKSNIKPFRDVLEYLKQERGLD